MTQPKQTDGPTMDQSQTRMTTWRHNQPIRCRGDTRGVTGPKLNGPKPQGAYSIARLCVDSFNVSRCGGVRIKMFLSQFLIRIPKSAFHRDCSFWLNLTRSKLFSTNLTCYIMKKRFMEIMTSKPRVSVLIKMCMWNARSYGVILLRKVYHILSTCMDPLVEL